MIERVVATPAARALVERLRAEYGDILLYQSHGCCEGSTPMCFRATEMPLTSGDRLLGRIGEVGFHVSDGQSEYLSGLELTLDVAPGDGGTFSLEDGSGQHFVVRLRLWTEEESQLLALQPPPSSAITLR